jgi:hypothetical protein
MTTKEVLRREPLIRNALRIIAPPPKLFEACHLDVVDSIITIELTTAYWKKEIGPLKSLQSALVRASRFIRPAGLAAWLDLTEEIALCTRRLAASSTGPSKQAAAVREAAWLISKWRKKRTHCRHARQQVAPAIEYIVRQGHRPLQRHAQIPARD